MIFLHPTAVSDVIGNATVYRARVGARLPFQTEAEALQYEGGWNDSLDGIDCRPTGAHAKTYALGWLHAERAAEDAREMRNDERREQDE